MLHCARAAAAAAALFARPLRHARAAPRTCAAMATSASSVTHTPRDVLTFWFGPEWESARKTLSSPAYFSSGERTKFWYSGGPAVDAQCAAFADVIHAAGRGELAAAPGWGATPAARVATVVLLDQLTRGAFRCATHSTTDAHARSHNCAVCPPHAHADLCALPCAAAPVYLPQRHACGVCVR
jgi:uncharacterized protein (DUF924 family)